LGASPVLRTGDRAIRFNSSTPKKVPGTFLGGLRYFRFYPLRVLAVRHNLSQVFIKSLKKLDKI
jgi:hypothetical protein